MFDTKTERAIKYLTPIYNNAQMDGYREALGAVLEAARKQVRAEKDPGEVSDGYHTFNELYHHRAVLFSVICNEHPELAWKSKRHSDGSMYDGMFIVGIDTPDGPATYHYDVEPYWEMFRVKELDRAPEWDGHTPAEAIMRIGTLCWEEEEPLSMDDLRKMDGQPVFIEHDILPKFNHVWVIWNNQVSDDIHNGLDGYGNFWRAYRRPPAKEESRGY